VTGRLQHKTEPSQPPEAFTSEGQKHSGFGDSSLSARPADMLLAVCVLFLHHANVPLQPPPAPCSPAPALHACNHAAPQLSYAGTIYLRLIKASSPPFISSNCSVSLMSSPRHS